MKIAITGDYCVNDRVIQLGESLKNLLFSCDYRICNFEGPLDDGINRSVKKSGPRLKMPLSSLDLLKRLNINALTLANNHILDEGYDGFYYTISNLKGFDYVGVGDWTTAYRPLIVPFGEKKVGVINFCEMQFGMLYDELYQGNNSIGCAWINHHKVNKLIIDTKKEVDVLIAICHAGVENINIPLPEWRVRYREFIELGCDAVIAHHPHVIQGFEVYNNKPICYSLGNFCFPQISKKNDDKWNMGAIAVLNIDSNKIKLDMHCCIFKDDKLEICENSDGMSHIKQLNSYLIGELYLNKINDYCTLKLDNYWKLFAAGGLFNPRKMTLKNYGRLCLGKYDYVHLLNNLQCESHRWVIERALRLKMNL